MADKGNWLDILTTAPASQRATQGQDYIFRVQTGATATVSVCGVPTLSLVNAIDHVIGGYTSSLSNSCRTLGVVIDRMKDRENYNNYYREFLLGNMTESEFEELAGKFAYTPHAANPAELLEQISVLLAHTTHDFTKDEVAELFQVSDQDVDRVLSSLQLPLFRRLESTDNP